MATAGTRIYRVAENDEFIALVRARSQSEAVRHCTANRFGAKVATPDELVALIGEGFKVEQAKAETEAA